MTVELAANHLALFRSVVLLWPADIQVQDHGGGVREFAAWLRRYDQEFKAQAVAEERLELLYHRSLTIVAAGDSGTSYLVRELCPLAHELGLAPVVHTRVVDFAGQIAAFRELLLACCPGTIVLDAEGVAPSGDERIGYDLATAVLTAGPSLSIVGPPSYWRSTGLLTSSLFNSKQPMVVFEDRTARPRGTAMRIYADAAAPGNSCMGRFRLFVTPDGLIYPCQELVGEKRFAIGSIHSPDLNDRVAGELLSELARTGPRVAGVRLTETSQFDSSPLICRLHKAQIEAAQTQ